MPGVTGHRDGLAKLLPQSPGGLSARLGTPEDRACKGKLRVPTESLPAHQMAMPYALGEVYGVEGLHGEVAWKFQPQ